MKTLSQIYNEYPLSRVTLERRMKKIPEFRSRYCTHGKYNKLLINDKGVKLITHEKHNSTSNSFHTRSGKGNQLTKSDLISTIHQLLDLNSRLKSENKSLHQGKNTLFLPAQKKLLDDNKAMKQRLSHITLKDWLKSKF